MPQVRLNVLDRPHVLRLRRHRPAQDLEVQSRNAKPLSEGLHDPLPVVVDAHHASVGVLEDEGVGRRIRAFGLPEEQLVSQSVWQVHFAQTLPGLAEGPDNPAVDGLGDRQRVAAVEGLPAEREELARPESACASRQPRIKTCPASVISTLRPR